MTNRLLTLVLILLPTGPWTAGVEAQNNRNVPNDVGCPSCALALDRVATLGGIGPALSRNATRIACDSRGRFFTASYFEPGRIAVYGSDGQHLRTFGREGRGPGEFHRISKLVVDRADSLHVFEQARHSVLGPGAQSFAHLNHLPFPISSAAFLSNNDMVVQRMVRREDGLSYPLHIMGRDGRISRSLAGRASWDMAIRQQGVFSFTVAADGRIWLGQLGTYRLEEWDSTGRHIQTLVRSPDWFEDWVDVPTGNILSKPRLTDVVEDSTGRLWTVLRVPDPTAPPLATQEIAVDAIDESLYEDTVVELIDPSSGRVVMRTRFEEALNVVGSCPLRFSTARERQDGLILMDIWRLRLVP